MQVARPPSRWNVACLVPYVLPIAVALPFGPFGPGPAHAFTFTLVSDGASQHLNWHWEKGYPIAGCQSNPTPCGDLASVNGMFSSSFSSFGGTGSSQTTVSGGALSWTGDDSLKVVATARVSARVSVNIVFPAAGYAESWAALNVRDFPLTFLMQAEPGDPAFTNLKITPELLGSFTVNTTATGSTSHLFMQTLVEVAVNGVKATGDTLFTEWEYANGDDGIRTLQFPRGGWNTVMLPNVAANSIVTVTLWSYVRPTVTAPATSAALAEITSTSPYGPGPAISVLAQPLGVVGVGDAPARELLALRALPNPSSGTTRIRFDLPRAGYVRLSIYDVAGHRVATPTEREEQAGSHELSWSGRNDRGDPLATGVYLVELLAGSERRVEKLILLNR